MLTCVTVAGITSFMLPRPARKKYCMRCGICDIRLRSDTLNFKTMTATKAMSTTLWFKLIRK